MRSALLLIQIFLFTNLSAQMNNWLPIKVNHKLGFIDTSGEILVEPKYDAVGNEPLVWNRFFTGQSDFILVENNEKLGLINANGQEVLAPNYTQIRPLNDTLFVVTIDSLFTVVNRSGEILMDARYEDVRVLYGNGRQVPEYFMVQKNSLWGIHKRKGHQVFSPQFGYIEIIEEGKGYFKVKKDYGDKHWALYGSDAKQLLPYKFTKIEVINDEFIICLDKDELGRYSVWDHEGTQVLPPEYLTYKKLNNHFIALKHKDTTPSRRSSTKEPTQQKEWQLYSFKKKEFITTPDDYDFFLPLDSNYVIAQKGELMGILDKDGKEVLEPTFTAIEKGRPPYYRVRKRNWGLFTLEDGLVVDCQYQAIAEFDQDNALVRKNNLYGMINTFGEEVISPQFEKIQREENFYKGFFDVSMTLFEMGDSGRVVSEEYFPEVYTLSIGYETDMFGDDVTMSDIQAFQNQGRNLLGNLSAPTVWSPFDTLEVLNTPWQWQRNEVFKRFELINTDRNQRVESPRYLTIRHIPEVRLTMVFLGEEPILNRLSAMTTFPLDTACSMALFSHEEGRFITDFEMMGLNRRDFQDGNEYARFIDKEGRFGLINQYGEQAKDDAGNPVRFTYIGEFKDGRARACLGGRISQVDEPKFQKFSVGFVRDFVNQFYITPTRFIPLNHVANFHVAPIGEEKADWGYINKKGKFIIDPTYDFANDFVDNSAINQKDGFWGIINEKEEIILDFKYSSISPFDGNWKISLPNSKPIFFNNKGHEIIGLKYSKFGGFSDEMCAVQIDSLWGFINKKGEEVIPCQFTEVKKFSEGWAAVRYDDYWFFIDKSGEKVLHLNDHIKFVETVGTFKNGLCWFKTGKWHGYFDKSGNIRIEAAFTKAFDFENGIARVVFNKKTGLIDTNGEWVLKPKNLEVIFPFDENGIAVIREHFKKPSGLINLKGEILTELKYRKIEPPKNGFYKVSDGDLWGFLDTNGKEVIPLMYDQAMDIENGLVAVSLPSQLTWFFINTKNERAFKGNYEIVESFNQGYAFVQKHEFDDATKMHIGIDGKRFNPNEGDLVMHYSEGIFGMYTLFGTRRRFRRSLDYYFCDKNGVNVFNRNFGGIEPFKNRAAPVKMNGKWGLINQQGVYVIEPKYGKINHLDNGLLHVRPGVLFGLANKKGEILIEPKYDMLEKSRGILRLEQGEAIGYVNQDLETIWEVQK